METRIPSWKFVGCVVFLCALFSGSMFLFANYGGEMHSQMAGVFYGWVLSFVLSVFVGFLVTNNVKLLATAALIHWIKQGGNMQKCLPKLLAKLLICKDSNSIASDIFFISNMNMALNFHL